LINVQQGGATTRELVFCRCLLCRCLLCRCLLPPNWTIAAFRCVCVCVSINLVGSQWTSPCSSWRHFTSLLL